MTNFLLLLQLPKAAVCAGIMFRESNLCFSSSKFQYICMYLEVGADWGSALSSSRSLWRKRVIFLSDLRRICFPLKKEMTATSTALWSWARLGLAIRKKINLFIGKHCCGIEGRSRANCARRKRSRGSLGNCHYQRSDVPSTRLWKWNWFVLWKHLIAGLLLRFWHLGSQWRSSSSSNCF